MMIYLRLIDMSLKIRAVSQIEFLSLLMGSQSTQLRQRLLVKAKTLELT